MGRRKKKGDPIHGWLVIDKPAEIGSTPIVGKARRFLNAQKAGHGGTLDPFATGLLPLAFGEATKTVSYVMDGIKTYIFTLKFGEMTDSLDLVGETVSYSDNRPTTEEIEAVLSKFIGHITQIPPKYSALKIDGQRAYDLARKGEEVDMKPRDAYVENLRLLEHIDTDHARFEVVCGKGFYVRSLGRDIAEALGTVGHLTTLRRTKIGPFSVESSILLEELEKKAHNPASLREQLLPIEVVLDGIPAIDFNAFETEKIRQGQPVSFTNAMAQGCSLPITEDTVCLALFEKKAVGLIRITQGYCHAVRIFVYQDAV